MKRSPWFPVWAGFQDDEPFLAVSAEAELLYLRGVARCKQLDQGTDGGHVGRHQLRRLCDKMTADPADLAAELCTVGLWSETATGWAIPAYGEWNSSAEEERQARADAGKRGNHARWNHPGPVDKCQVCNPPVSPDESGRIPNAIAPGSQCDSDRTRKPSLDVDETRRDVDDIAPLPPIPRDSHRSPDDSGLVQLADQMVQTATQDPTAVADAAQRQAVAEVLAAGHPPSAVLAAGQEAATGHRPVGLLRAILKRLAAEAPAPAERRPLLDDERAPCDTCGGSGRFGDFDATGRPGPVIPCPACHPLGAPA